MKDNQDKDTLRRKGLKVEIVTFHRAFNYGAVLQCYALSAMLRQMGVCVEVLDYCPWYFIETYYRKKQFCIRHLPIKTWMVNFLLNDILKERCKRFEKFIQDELPLSQRIYHSADEINERPPECDFYMTGSDQVFNTVCACFDSVYFLDFPDARKKKRCSYAASFGMTELPEDLKEEYRRRLSGYDAYSVRERSGAVILKELLGAEASVNCDPTLLLKRQKWEEICSDVAGRREKYILIYYVEESQKLFEKASELSKEKNMRVVSLPCNMGWRVLLGQKERRYGFARVPESGPKEFLALFRDAEYVLTNSFHGTVFSILFRKKFLTQTRDEDGKENTRAAELFQELGINDRDMAANFSDIDNVPDWKRIEEKKDAMAKRSMEYLRAIAEEKKIERRGE